MTLESYFLYSLVCIAATATPGPAILLVITNSLKYDLISSLVTALGNISCLLILCIISIFGINTILSEIPVFFEVVKILGGLYLIYLGIKSWRHSSSLNISDGKTEMANDNQQIPSKLKLYKEAFLVAASNPKALLFVFALFPQFINMNNSLPLQFFVLTITLMLFSFFFLMLYAYFASVIRDKAVSASSVSNVYRSSGVIFMLAGILMLRTKLAV